MTAEVNIVASQSEGLLLPASAERGGAVWVVEDGRARRRRVTTGLRDLTTVEVRSGVAEGELVVLAPPSALEDGARVRAERREPVGRTPASGPAQASLP